MGFESLSLFLFKAGLGFSELLPLKYNIQQLQIVYL